MKLTNLNDDLKLRMLLYGLAGSGKSRLCATAAIDPRLAPVLYLDVGANPFSFKDYPVLPTVVTIERLEDFNPIYAFFKGGQQVTHPFAKAIEFQGIPFKTVVIDHITEIQRWVMLKASGQDKLIDQPGVIPAQLELRDFNRVLAHTVSFASAWYGLLSLNVILVAQENEKQDQATGTLNYAPLLWGSGARELDAFAMLTGRLVQRARISATQLNAIESTLETKGAKIVNALLLNQTGKYQAKNQYCMGVPYLIEPTMTDIADLIELK